MNFLGKWLVSLRASSALSMFNHAVKKLQSSNTLAQKIIKKNDIAVAKLHDESIKLSGVVSRNDKVIAKINAFME